MGSFMILCQCFILITCVEFCRAHHCIQLEKLTMKSDNEKWNMQNAKNMSFCNYPVIKTYEITETNRWEKFTFFEYIEVDITYVYNKSLSFTVHGENFNGKIECKFMNKDDAVVFLTEIRSVLKGYVIDRLIQYWTGSQHRPMELSRPAELYVKNTAEHFKEFNDSRILYIWSQLKLGNQVSYLTSEAKELALSEITHSNLLCLCVKNSNRVFVLYFSNPVDAENFKNSDIGPYTDLKMECNFPQEVLRSAKKKNDKSSRTTKSHDDDDEIWYSLELLV